jgi:hypothetical protein
VKSAFAIRTAQANGRRMLKVLITESHIRFRTYERRIDEHRNATFTTTNTSYAKLLQDTINNVTQEYQSRRRTELQRKLNNSRSYQRNHNNANASVKNISHKKLTEQQTQVLAKGLNYNTTDTKKLYFITDLESALKNTELTEENKNNICHQVTTNLLHLNHSIDLTKQEREALEDLKVYMQ